MLFRQKQFKHTMILRNKHITNSRIFPIIFHKTFPNKRVSFFFIVVQTYSRIPLELLVDPLGYAEHTLGTTVLDVFSLDAVK